MTLRIVTDSTADIDAQTAADLGISIVPLRLYFGQQSYLDGVEISPAEFFARLPAANPLPRTTAPAPGDFLSAYARLANEADEILCITVSAKLSGTLNAARTAAELFGDSARIAVLDSLGATAALANVVLIAARAARSGFGLDATQAVARSTAERQRILIGLETLEYLQRGGRIGRARAFLGGLLHVKPLITLDQGEVVPAERVRSRARMRERLCQFATSYPHAESIRIAHAGVPDECGDLADQIRRAATGLEVTTSWIGPVVGVYTGPGALGVAVVPRGHP
jgi:DegV family protein with EDD domain